MWNQNENKVSDVIWQVFLCDFLPWAILVVLEGYNHNPAERNHNLICKKKKIKLPSYYKKGGHFWYFGTLVKNPPFYEVNQLNNVLSMEEFLKNVVYDVKCTLWTVNDVPGNSTARARPPGKTPQVSIYSPWGVFSGVFSWDIIDASVMQEGEKQW